MQHTLSDTWTRRGLIIVAVLATLAALSVSLIPSTSAQQGLPEIPHWFWGTDAHAFNGARVSALDQNGNVLAVTEEEDHPVVRQGGWSYAIATDEASRVTFRIDTRDGTFETDPKTVIGDGEDTEISIAEFRHEVTAAATKPIQIIARLHPTRTYRTVEFNIRINGVDADPAPRARYMSPREATNRWLESSLIDAGDGFQVRVIACKRDNDSLVFGLRVEGHDDILPRQRLFSSSIEDNRWKHSNPIDVPLPGRQGEGFELSRDEGCTGGHLAP